MATASTSPKTAGSGTSAPRTRTENGTRKALGRAGSLKRSTITERCAIEKAIIAPKANVPTRNSRSCGIASPKAIAVAITIATDGVPRSALRRPTALGI